MIRSTFKPIFFNLGLLIFLLIPSLNIHAAAPSLLDNLLNSEFNMEDEPLHVDKAFKFSSLPADSEKILLRWDIADKHYLYNHAFQFSLENKEGVSLGKAIIPAGKPKTDQFFGDISVYYGGVDITLPFTKQSSSLINTNLKVTYQGCADRGICYPPETKIIPITLAAHAVGDAVSPTIKSIVDTSPKAAEEARVNQVITTANDDFNLNQEQDNLLDALKSGNLLLILAAFFGAGLLLSFTPCVFPMIPILSGIITGQKGEVTTRKAFILSLVYILSMALVYTLIGVASGIIGESIQAWFQKPWVLLLFGLIIVLMALSMFGLFSLQMPQSIQSKASNLSNQQKSGSLFGVAIMGMLSALIVGACSTPVLAVAIGYIGKTADPILGGMGLFAMSIGMGLPLLIIGTSAGKLLPQKGAWMDQVKYVFGALMLAVALYIIDPVLPTRIMMGLWAALLIGCGVYMGALNSKLISGWQKLYKSLGLVAVIYGIIMLVGMATGKGQLLSPLKGLLSGGVAEAEQHLQFKRIRGITQLDQHLDVAKKNQQFVMLDFYADWCKSCLELEEFTFPDPEVQKTLANVVLLQADVTLNDDIDKALLKRFKINGPPAILFFDKDSNEIRTRRLNGFFEPKNFTRHVRATLQ